jgi:hypothetical protein
MPGTTRISSSTHGKIDAKPQPFKDHLPWHCPIKKFCAKPEGVYIVYLH